MTAKRQQPQGQIEKLAESKARGAQKMAAMRDALDEAITLQKARHANPKRHQCLGNYRWYRRWLWFLTMQEVRFNLWWANLWDYFRSFGNPWREAGFRVRRPVAKMIGGPYLHLFGWWPRRWSTIDWLFVALLLAMWISWFAWLGYLWLVIC